jgi:hypothetical protein
MKNKALSGDLLLEDAMDLLSEDPRDYDNKLHLFSLSQDTFN